MDILGLFVGTVLAFEGIISPLPDLAQVSVPTRSFGSYISPEVLGDTTAITPTPILTSLTPTPSEKPETPTPAAVEKRTAKKKAITIALIGDSMIDTLGTECADLQTALKAIYPQTAFTLLNFGVGGTNIDYGIERVTHGYTYLQQQHPSLVSTNPDLVIIESFAYNPYSYDTGAIDHHWLALATMVDTIKTHLPNTNMLLFDTIAPNARVFGDGAAGLSFDPQAKREKVAVIKSYLESTLKFAASQHIPLADAYTPSLQKDGNGNPVYINAGDHIHYSPEGRIFVSSILTKAIVEHKSIE
jgi:hypothetical protein